VSIRSNIEPRLRQGVPKNGRRGGLGTKEQREAKAHEKSLEFVWKSFLGVYREIPVPWQWQRTEAVRLHHAQEVDDAEAPHLTSNVLPSSWLVVHGREDLFSSVARVCYFIPSFSSTSIIWGFSHGCRPPEWDAVCDWDSVAADLAPSVTIAVNRSGGRARSRVWGPSVDPGNAQVSGKGASPVILSNDSMAILSGG